MVALGLAACAPTVPPAPAPVPLPEIEVETPNFTPGRVFLLPPPVVDARFDVILHSEWAYHPGIQDRAGYWMEVFTERERDWFPLYLQRMARYAPLVDSMIAEAGLPASLRYLPVIESGYSPRAVSVASAAGMWQFMAPVARSFGMRVDAMVDERRDPIMASAAAIQYLSQLYDRFGSWYLALAAYNGGPTRVARLVREHAPLAPVNDSLFLAIRDYLPSETRDFIPKLLAAATVGEQPERYGLRLIEPNPVLAFDEVEVPDAASLDVVARAAGVAEEVIRELNPQIMRGVTPRGRATRIRLPSGLGASWQVAFAAIPESERVTVTEHVVRSGETMSGIASRYGISSSDLQAANPGIRPRTLQIGAQLLVPLVPGALSRVGEIVASRTTAVRAIPTSGIHVVRAGENLWLIAQRYGLGSETLKDWNELDGDPVLHPGDQIRLVDPAGG